MQSSVTITGGPVRIAITAEGCDDDSGCDAELCTITAGTVVVVIVAIVGLAATNDDDDDDCCLRIVMLGACVSTPQLTG